MKNIFYFILPWVGLAMLPLSARAQAEDYVCTISRSAIIIKEYTGAGGVVIIPGMIDSLPVVGIGKGAFSAYGSVANMTSVTIPVGVTTIGNSAFKGCTLLTHVTIPASVIRIADQAFYDCIGLSEITIPGDVTLIAEAMFMNCTSLTNVTLSAAVADIQSSAFAGCSNLEGIHFKGDAPALGQDVFKDAEKVTIYYPLGAMGWEKEFGGRPTCPRFPLASPALVLRKEEESVGYSGRR